MRELPLSLLFGLLILLILLSAFFSSSETGMMASNRYRLRHLAKDGHHGAKRVLKLLERPDRLIGLILLGNNFVNILASSIATLIGLRLFGDVGLAIATGLLTLVLLIFAEVAPKTLAALHPERLSYATSLILRPLLWLLSPLVWAVNLLSNTVLRMFGVRGDSAMNDEGDALSRDELRSVVNEASALIPPRHRRMLVNILDLEQATVNDIMVPRNEIVGIDLNDEWEDIVQQLRTTQHTRLPVWREDIENLVGILHLRRALPLLREQADKGDLVEAARAAYFVPEATPLNTQLLKFQKERRRIGIVVDEYGDIQGLVTLEDILEEIVGKFTTETSDSVEEAEAQDDGSYMVDGSALLRELNYALRWEFPTDGPRTLNGLIQEHLESIPEPGTSLRVAGYPMDVIQVSDNQIKRVRIYPALRQKD